MEIKGDRLPKTILKIKLKDLYFPISKLITKLPYSKLSDTVIMEE